MARLGVNASYSDLLGGRGSRSALELMLWPQLFYGIMGEGNE
jgi:hypothetical protein